jgi:membrane dipeptidase
VTPTPDRTQVGRSAAMAIGLALGVLVSTLTHAQAPDDGLRERADRLHREAIVVDGHNDITSFVLDYGFDLGMDGTGPGKRDATAYWIPWLRWLAPHSVDELRTDTDIRRLRAGGVDALFFSIFAHTRYAKTPGAAPQRALLMIEALRDQLGRHPEDLELATRSADIRRIVARNRIAALMGLEGGHAIEGDLDTLRRFYDLGVRYMTLTWEASNRLGDSCYDEPHGGLTELGAEVVAEMNDLGMMVDVSHVSDATFFDVIDATRAPVIASHSSARALVDHPRNMSDTMLRAVAGNGGVVMVNFQDTFVDPRKAGYAKGIWYAITHLGWEPTPLSNVIDHVDHVARTAGIDHVGLGSDFAGTFFMPEGIEDVSEFPNVTYELLRRGYSDEAVRKILGGNLLRVFAEVEAAAKRR